MQKKKEKTGTRARAFKSVRISIRAGQRRERISRRRSGALQQQNQFKNLLEILLVILLILYIRVNAPRETILIDTVVNVFHTFLVRAYYMNSRRPAVIIILRTAGGGVFKNTVLCAVQIRTTRRGRCIIIIIVRDIFSYKRAPKKRRKKNRNF